MITFFMKANIPAVEFGEFTNMVKFEVGREFQIAIGKFLEAMLARIPIRTGFLSGSFIRIANKYGFAHSPGGGTSTKPEYYRQGGLKILKSVSSGQSLAKDIYEFKGNLFIFNIDNAIIYWRINDLFFKGKGTPWKSVEAGTRAMIKHLDTIPGKFPKLIQKIIGFNTVIVQGKSIKVLRRGR